MNLSVSGYADEDRPLGAYGALSGAFGAGLAVAVVALARSNRLPERVATQDLALIGVATHKLSRLVTKDKVTSVLRAPFTRYQQPAGHGELEERARGQGLQRAIGELLTCPYCVAQWIAGAFTVGMVTAPRPTRLIAGIYAAETISDFLQLAYRAAEEKT